MIHVKLICVCIVGKGPGFVFSHGDTLLSWTFVEKTVSPTEVSGHSLSFFRTKVF